MSKPTPHDFVRWFEHELRERDRRLVHYLFTQAKELGYLDENGSPPWSWGSLEQAD